MACQPMPLPQPARRRERWFIATGTIALLLALALFVALLVQLLAIGGERLDWTFLSQYPSRHADQAGILAALSGTVHVMAITTLVAVPLGVAAAVYLQEYARHSRWTSLIEINISNLAAVPSIVYGLLALGLFVQAFGLGQSLLTAGLTLSLLILPTVIVSTREALRSVPASLREGAMALGATRWQMVSHHVLPAALPGLLTGVILGLARAIGETAPLLTLGALTFVAFLPPPMIDSQFPFVSLDWLSSPMTTLPTQIYAWITRDDPGFRANAAAAALVLVLLTLLLSGGAMALRARLRRHLRW
jgi:phosphate transport system permease protein